MSDLVRRAVQAIESLPQEKREDIVSMLEERVEAFFVLRAQVQEGLDDVAAGRVTPFDMNEIRAMAEELATKKAELDV